MYATDFRFLRAGSEGFVTGSSQANIKSDRRSPSNALRTTCHLHIHTSPRLQHLLTSDCPASGITWDRLPWTKLEASAFLFNSFGIFAFGCISVKSARLQSRCNGYSHLSGRAECDLAADSPVHCWPVLLNGVWWSQKAKTKQKDDLRTFFWDDGCDMSTGVHWKLTCEGDPTVAPLSLCVARDRLC